MKLIVIMLKYEYILQAGGSEIKRPNCNGCPFEPQLSNDNVINTRNVSMYDDKDDLKQEINKFRIRSMLCDISYENV